MQSSRSLCHLRHTCAAAVGQSVEAQIRLEQLLHAIRRSAQMTPDYVSLLFAASALAGLGLATDNVVVVIASMLISPIMGPVLALTFGVNVHDFRLAALGFAVRVFHARVMHV